MADLSDLDFDAGVDPPRNFAPIPSGKYLVVIADSSRKPTNSGLGEYVELEFEIEDGPHRKRRLWDKFNVLHPDPKVERIAKQKLKSIFEAVGVLKPTDSSQLHDRLLVAHVRRKKRDGVDEMTNEVRSYSPNQPTVETKSPLVTPTNSPAAKPSKAHDDEDDVPPSEKKSRLLRVDDDEEDEEDELPMLPRRNLRTDDDDVPLPPPKKVVKKLPAEEDDVSPAIEVVTEKTAATPAKKYIEEVAAPADEDDDVPLPVRGSKRTRMMRPTTD